MKTANFKKVFMLSLCCFSLLSFTTSCKKNQTAISGDWQLRFFAIEDEAQSICPCTVAIKSGNPATISGFSGVNTFHTTFTQNGSSVQVDKNIATTKMAGSDEAMAFENEFLSFLASSTSMTTQKDEGIETLKIAGDKKSAIFERLLPTDTLWLLTLVNTGNALVSVPLNDESENADGDEIVKSQMPTLLLENGNASVFTCLNQMNANYKLDTKSHSLTFNLSQGTMTLVSGSEEDMNLENAYLNLLNQVTNYAISGKNLILTDKDGTNLLTFEKQDWL